MKTKGIPSCTGTPGQSPEFDLLNSGCGLSAGAAYLRGFTVLASKPNISCVA